MTQTSSIRADSVSVAQPWASRAEQLADWALERLAHRGDSWVIFPPLYRRVGDDTAVVTRGTLTRQTLRDHFADHDHSHIIGLHCISVENTCRWLAFSTRGTADAPPVNPIHARDGALRILERLGDYGIRATLVDCGADADFQIWVLLDRALPAEPVHAFARSVVDDAARTGQLPPVTIYPTGHAHNDGRWNTWLRVPGHHHCRPKWSRIYHDGRWLEGSDAVNRLLASDILDAERFAALIDPDQPSSTMREDADDLAYDIAALPLAQPPVQTSRRAGSLPDVTADEDISEADEQQFDDGYIDEFTDSLNAVLDHEDHVEPGPPEPPEPPVPAGTSKHNDVLPQAPPRQQPTHIDATTTIDSTPGNPENQPLADPHQVEAASGESNTSVKLPRHTPEVVARIETYLAKVPRGLNSGQGRNTMAFRIASFLIHEIGLSADQALPLAARWNQENHPPLEPAHLEQIVRNLARRQDDDQCDDSQEQEPLGASSEPQPAEVPDATSPPDESDPHLEQHVATDPSGEHQPSDHETGQSLTPPDLIDAYAQSIYVPVGVIDVAGAFANRRPATSGTSTARAHGRVGFGFARSIGGGLRPGQITTIQADSPHDQTAFGLQLADGIAANNTALRDAGRPVVPVMYVAVGCGGFGLVQLSISRISGVPQHLLSTRRFLGDEAKRVAVEEALTTYRSRIAPHLEFHSLPHSEEPMDEIDLVEQWVGQLKSRTNADSAVLVIDPINLLFHKHPGSSWAARLNHLHHLSHEQQLATVLLIDPSAQLAQSSHISHPRDCGLLRRFAAMRVQISMSDGASMEPATPPIDHAAAPCGLAHGEWPPARDASGQPHPGTSKRPPSPIASADHPGYRPQTRPDEASASAAKQATAYCYPFLSEAAAVAKFNYEPTTGYYHDITAGPDETAR